MWADDVGEVLVKVSGRIDGEKVGGRIDGEERTSQDLLPRRSNGYLSGKPLIRVDATVEEDRGASKV